MNMSFLTRSFVGLSQQINKCCLTLSSLAGQRRNCIVAFSSSAAKHAEDRDIANIYDSMKSYKSGSIDLDLSGENRIAVITINHPAKRNALSGSMMCDLLDIVKQLEADEHCVALVLHGKGGSFCSGGDLDVVNRGLNTEYGSKMCRFMQHTLHRFNSLPQVSVSLLEGAALGGGAELATWTDLRIAAPNAKIAFVQGRLGITTGWGATTRLTELVGARQALQLLLRASPIKAEDAHRLGLVDLLLPATQSAAQDANLRAALNWLTELSSHLDINVMRAYKRATRNATTCSRLDALKHERTEFERFWGQPLHKSKLAAQSQRKK